MIKNITYEDKVSIQNDESVARKNKVTDEDMNEIKETVNANADEQIAMQTDINNIKDEQTTQNTNIEALETDNTTNKQDITEIKAKDTDQDKYIAELEAENTRLREDLNGLPTRQASGESIDLSDSAEMRCDLKISGNSKQETREGRNKFDIRDTEGTTINSIENSSFTIKNKWNTKIISGANLIKNLEKNTQYIITADVTLNEKPAELSVYDSTQKRLMILYNFSDNNFVDVLTTENAEEKKNWIVGETKSLKCSFTTPTNLENYSLTSYTYYNQNAEFTFDNVMIRKATDVNETYEQYGASPSPDYPSEVESCGDNINLYNAPYRENNKLIITATQDDYYKILSYYAYLEAGKKYRVSFESDGSYGMDSGTDTIQIFLMKDKSFDTMITIFSKNEIISPTVSGNYYIRADVNKNGKSHSFWNFKIKKGTTASPYSPYGQGCINEVICNKNLANFEIKKSSLIGINGTYKGSEVTFNGITTQGENITPGSYSGTKIASLKAGTYTISWITIGTITLNGGATQVAFRNASGKNLATKNLESKNFSKTITIEEDTDIYLQIYANSSNIVINNYIMKIQIEEGTDTTYCIEHKSQTYTIPVQQPMRSVGDIRDEFVKVDDKWFERHYIERLILDGTEIWVKSNTALNGFWCSDYRNTITDKIALCNIAKYTSDIEEYKNKYSYFCTKDCDININVPPDVCDDNVTSWKAYLSEQNVNGTPVYVDCILAKPLDIECTEEQNKILDQIEKEVKTYKNVTHMYSTDKISSYKEVTYKIDLETRLNNIEQAILSQGGNI